MHVPDCIGTYVRFRWLTGVLILGSGLYLGESFLLSDRSLSEFASTAIHLSVLWAALGTLGLLWVAVDFFCYRYYWRHRLAAGYLNQMAIHMFPKPCGRVDPASYLWSVYRTAPTLSARLVAAEWIGLMGGFSLAGSSQDSRSRRAIQEALASYQESLDHNNDPPKSSTPKRGHSGVLEVDSGGLNPFEEEILRSQEMRLRWPKAVS